MTIDEAIDFYNDNSGRFGSRNLCDALGITKQNVPNWRKRGRIPYVQQIRIQELTNMKLKATYNNEETK